MPAIKVNSATKEQFSHAATIMPVSDVGTAISFYEEKLGFTLSFSWESPPSYAVLKRGAVGVHLSQRDGIQEGSSTRASLYIFVFDVDAVYAEFKSRSVAIHAEIGDRDYGMRDFDVVDPDGNLLTFGTGK